MANILLGVTGSVAAIRVPQIYQELRKRHEVKVVATKASLYFFDPDEIPTLIRDEDEWPGERYQRGDEVVHIELRRWADLFVIAPLDANTLAKLAHGLSDNCLTCVWRAWDRSRPLILAPAMNTLMWEHPLTGRHLRQIASDLENVSIPDAIELSGLSSWINDHCTNLRVIAPQEKELACGDVGTGAIAETSQIVHVIETALIA